jgi:hypothetical protein
MYHSCHIALSRDCVVRIVTRLRAGQLTKHGSILGMDKGFLFIQAYKLTLPPTQSRIEWVSGVFHRSKAAGA